MCVLSIGFSLAWTGCSVIGLGIGTAIDSNGEDERSVPGWEILTVDPGTIVTIFLRSGNVVRGSFRGIVQVPWSEYVIKYKNAQETQNKNGALPDLGTKISVTLRSGEKFMGKFTGFDFDQEPSIATEGVWYGTNKVRFFETMLDSLENEIDVFFLRALLSDGKIPYRQAISIETGIKTRVPFEDVSVVHVPAKKNAALTGFLIGAALDVVVLAIAANTRVGNFKPR